MSIESIKESIFTTQSDVVGILQDTIASLRSWRFWIGPELNWIMMLVLMLMLTLGVNGAIEINAFLSSVNVGVYAEIQCE